MAERFKGDLREREEYHKESYRLAGANCSSSQVVSSPSAPAPAGLDSLFPSRPKSPPNPGPSIISNVETRMYMGSNQQSVMERSIKEYRTMGAGSMVPTSVPMALAPPPLSASAEGDVLPYRSGRQSPIPLGRPSASPYGDSSVGLFQSGGRKSGRTSPIPLGPPSTSRYSEASSLVPFRSGQLGSPSPTSLVPKKTDYESIVPPLQVCGI